MSEVVQPPEPSELRRVFGAFPSGVIALAALNDGAPTGMAASSFTSVSMDPPLVSLCIANSSTTWPSLRDLPRLGLSVLGAAQSDGARELASRNPDRFANLNWRATPQGAVMLEGASAWFDCSIYAVHEGGDHEIVVLRIHELDADHSVNPLVFHASKFHSLDV